jgi:membrane protease YdiL (CAAX protease family)
MSIWTLQRNRLLIVAIAVALGIGIAAIGLFPWTIFAQLNVRLWPGAPWCVPVGLVWLILFWTYLNGKGWPRSTSRERHELLRARALNQATGLWSVIAAAIGLVTLVAIYLIAIQFVNLPRDAFRPRGLAGLSLGTIIPVLVMNAIVAGIVEEAAYRGYMQGLLEPRIGAAFAIAVVTIVFTVLHLLGGTSTLPLAIPVCATSVVLGVLTVLTRSIFPAVVMHSLADAPTLPLEWGIVGHLPVGRFQANGIDTFFMLSAAVSVVGSVATVAALLKLRRLARERRRH